MEDSGSSWSNPIVTLNTTVFLSDRRKQFFRLCWRARHLHRGSDGFWKVVVIQKAKPCPLLMFWCPQLRTSTVFVLFVGAEDVKGPALVSTLDEVCTVFSRTRRIYAVKYRGLHLFECAFPVLTDECHHVAHCAFVEDSVFLTVKVFVRFHVGLDCFFLCLQLSTHVGWLPFSPYEYWGRLSWYS